MTELGQKKYASAISKTCQDRLMGLADCVSDNDPFSGATMTSLSTSDGCCLQGCVDAIQAVSGTRRAAWGVRPRAPYAPARKAPIAAAATPSRTAPPTPASPAPPAARDPPNAPRRRSLTAALSS